MSRPTIALCMIVKDEEHNLPRVLESVEGCFDEIHITDTGSTDNTVEIAKKYGAKVHHFKWVNDFGAAREYSYSHTKCDYIMWLDADDYLDNKEAFKKFREEAIHLAEYWIATYHYANDNGKPVCSFIRERVTKNNGKFYWKSSIFRLIPRILISFSFLLSSYPLTAVIIVHAFLHAP